MSSRDHIAGKAIAVKGESAEETDFPKSVSGTVQNMYRTVTYVERYQGYGPNDEFTEELCHECALRESVIHGIFYGKERMKNERKIEKNALRVCSTYRFGKLLPAGGTCGRRGRGICASCILCAP